MNSFSSAGTEFVTGWLGLVFFLVILWFLGCSRGEEESGDFFRRPDHVFQQSSGREAKALCLNGIRLIRIH